MSEAETWEVCGRELVDALRRRYCSSMQPAVVEADAAAVVDIQYRSVASMVAAVSASVLPPKLQRLLSSASSTRVERL